jgi:hypothetical protein
LKVESWFLNAVLTINYCFVFLFSCRVVPFEFRIDALNALMRKERFPDLQLVEK